MSATPFTPVDAPCNETCDDCGIAKSLVAVRTRLGSRLTFCGHDYDKISPTYRAEVFDAVNDTRVSIGS